MSGPVKIDLEKAKRAQVLIAGKVVEKDGFSWPPRLVGGVDVAFKGDTAIGAAVVLRFGDLRVVDRAFCVRTVRVPYIPTFLAFREVAAMAEAVRRLRTRPDVVLVDAHGKLHPRKAGEATHLGVVLDIPTVGVAKSRLVGTVRDDGYVVYKGEVLGYRLETGVYVSVGHRVTLETAIKLVRQVTRYSIPEPTRQAHIYANELRRRLDELRGSSTLL